MKDIKNAIDHLKTHQKYPATKEQLIEECNKLSDFSQEDKKWFMDNLPDKTFSSPDDVIQALGWTTKAQSGMMDEDSMMARP